MNNKIRWILPYLFILFAMLFGACGNNNNPTNGGSFSSLVPQVSDSNETISENGSYISKEEVSLYLHTYGRLSNNYITKKEAQKMGWDSKKGNLTSVAPGKSIGGSHYGNYEGLLPVKQGREWAECDIDYTGGRRNAKRIIYSNDGLIYYTEDHYKTFELLYE